MKVCAYGKNPSEALRNFGKLLCARFSSVVKKKGVQKQLATFMKNNRGGVAIR